MVDLRSPASRLACLYVLEIARIVSVEAFSVPIRGELPSLFRRPPFSGSFSRPQCSRLRPSFSALMAAVPRYGPPMDDNARVGRSKKGSVSQNNDADERRQEMEFRSLLEKVMAVKDPQHVPSLLTKNVELVLSLSSQNGVRIVETILEETKASAAAASQGEEAVEAVSHAIDLILTFVETFVEQASGMEDQNKKLLGKIIRKLSSNQQQDNPMNTMAAPTREQDLDQLLHEEREHLTAGFLRHLEGECARIANAPTMTPESARLLEILRLIQTRVLEEMLAASEDLGEAAQVLGQLVGYASASERQAVLEAGLTVRGPAFAEELLALTQEALEGFQRVVGGADPGLVDSVEQIDGRIRRYLDDHQRTTGDRS